MVHQKNFSDKDDANDKNCNMVSLKDEVILRKPTKKDIGLIIVDMVAHVQTRAMLHKNDSNKVSSIFIKKSNPKEIKVSEPKDVYAIKVKTMSKKLKPKKV